MAHALRSHPFHPAFAPQAAWLALLLATSAPASAAGPVITEFMAANSETLLDEDQQASDWIEIHNPDPTPVNLAGWSLTDDPTQLTLWRFPDRTLAPGGFLVVFASGKNRTAAAPAPLHTNFRLEAAGEFLALVQPDGQTLASAFSPNFPAQIADVSFGTPTRTGPRDLLATSLPRFLVPTQASQLPPNWTQPVFIPDATWRTGSGLGVGFDSTPAGPAAGTNLARTGRTDQSSAGFGFSPDAAIDGDPDTFTHTATDDNQSTWSVDLGAAFELARIVIRNRTSCCQSRLRDLHVTLLGPDAQSVVWRSDLINPENQLGSPASITLDFAELNLDAPLARVVRIERIPDPDLSGSGGVGNDDEDNVLSLGEVEVFGISGLSLAPALRTDLADLMPGQASSAFLRIPFVLEDPASLRGLELQFRYNDGVALHLNGTPIDQRHSPANPLWNSLALEPRDKTNSLTFESLDLAPFRNLWIPGTNWLAVQVLNAGISDPDLLFDARLIPDSDASGVSFAAFLDQPTPGAPNDTGWNRGLVADTKFGTDRGFFDAPFALTLSTATPDATIRYTLDGTAPTATTGALYQNPIPITQTTIVRAAAFRPEYRPSNVDTHTYVFLAQVVNQENRPPGFPSSWAGVNADYAMDPRITRAAAYTNRITESLLALPSVSIVTPLDNLFGTSQGIYANPERNGISWERPISLEWLEPNGNNSFQADCGLRIQGGYFRQRSVTRKHSLRLLFKNEYGPGRLRRDLFRQFGAAREFDTLVLRAGANDGYSWDAARDTEQFTRDQFGRDLSRALGQVSGHGRFVHLYLNGLYWGLYNLTERPAEDFSATYFGGPPENWDAINSGEVKNGSLQAWNAFVSAVRSTSSLADYQKLKGLNPDGSPNPSHVAYLDAPNYIDYMLVNIWGGNWDWPNKNFWFAYDRTRAVPGFKFYLWDFENTMGNNRDRSPLSMVSPRPGTTTSWVGEPHDRLKRASAEYRLEFADRVQRAFFDGGPLSPDALVARYRQLAQNLEPAIIAETARWGDDHWSPPQDLSDWQRERDWLLQSYLPQRTAVVLAQLRADGLYPNLAAPSFSPPSGPVPPNSFARITTSAPEIFYTTNGLDPRLPGGSILPSALRLSDTSTPNPTPSENPSLIRSGASWRYLADGSDPGPRWPHPDFVDASWKAGPSPLGYGDNDETTVVPFVDVNPTQSGIQRNATTFFRSTFTLAHPEAFERIRLTLTYDDAAAVFLNGQEIFRTDNLPPNATFSTYASSASSDNAIASRDDVPRQWLVPGTNIVAVEIHQSDAGSSDISFDLELTGIPVGAATRTLDLPLPNAPVRFLTRAKQGDEWSALVETSYHPDAVPASSLNLVISEICYRPVNPTNVSETSISRDRDAFEFLEFLNIASNPIVLDGVRCTRGVLFAFPPGTSLPPGQRLVIASLPDALIARYGPQVPIAGTYDGQLDNNGEELEVLDATGQPITRFRYDDKAPWPSASGDAGYSLVLQRPFSRPDPSKPENWRSSVLPLGSPGTSDATHFVGQPEADTNGNGQADIFDYALGTVLNSPSSTPLATLSSARFGIVLPWNPAADDILLRLEAAPTLDGPWSSDPALFEFVGETRAQDGTARVEYRLLPSIPDHPSLFVRISLTLSP